jgi:hypothetical protein
VLSRSIFERNTSKYEYKALPLRQFKRVPPQLRKYPSNYIESTGRSNILDWPYRSSSGYSLPSHRGGPGSRPGRQGRFCPSTSVSLANRHSTKFSIIIIIRGWHSRLIGSRSALWTKLGSPPTIPIRKSS